MTAPRFFWHPAGINDAYSTDAADVETIDLPLGSVLCDYDPTGDAALPTSGTGDTIAVANLRGMQVKIRCDLGNEKTIARSLYAMVSRLKEGGHCGFAFDADWAWFVQIDAAPERGDGGFEFGTNVAEVWGGPSGPSVDWPIYISSPLPQHRREVAYIASTLGSAIVTDDPIVFNYDAGNGFVTARHKFFFPFLRYVSGDVYTVKEVAGLCYVFDATFKLDLGLEQLEIPTSEVTESEEVEVDAITLWVTDFEGIDVPGEFYDWGDLQGNFIPTGDGVPDDGGWSRSPGYAFLADGIGGFVLQDSGLGPPPYDNATGNSQAFQIGVDPDAYMDGWYFPSDLPSSPGDYAVLFEHANDVDSYCALRINSDHKLEWVVAESGAEVVIVTTTTSVTTATAFFVRVNWHDGVTSIGLGFEGDTSGTWEDSATDHTDYDQFSTSIGDGEILFLYTASLAGGGGSVTNFVGLADDFKARFGAYWSDATVGNTFPVPDPLEL